MGDKITELPGVDRQCSVSGVTMRRTLELNRIYAWSLNILKNKVKH